MRLFGKGVFLLEKYFSEKILFLLLNLNGARSCFVFFIAKAMKDGKILRGIFYGKDDINSWETDFSVSKQEKLSKKVEQFFRKSLS